MNRVLKNARIPAALAEGLSGRDLGNGLIELDLPIAGGKIAPASLGAPQDLGGKIVLPCFVDAHVHLDKTYTAQRAGVSRTGLDEAVGLAMQDAPNRTAADLDTRMERAAEAAYRAGTVALRSHIDSMQAPNDNPGWQALVRLQQRWAGRLTIEPVALMRIERAIEDSFADRCAQIAATGGLAGGYISGQGCDPAMIDRFFEQAAGAGLGVDFHVDETADASARGIESVLDAMTRTGFAGRVTLSHCCKLSAQSPSVAQPIVERMAALGVHVISLPLSNAFLMGRAPGQMSPLRGMTRVQELAAAGVPVSFASDNVQDPFYAYGAYDMFEVMRAGLLIAQLEGDAGHWLQAITRTPASAMGLQAGVIGYGRPADLIIFDAYDWADLFSRAHENRTVLRAGAPLPQRTGQ
ncbi:amidohydrolase family protein [Ketogulonicigenium vulgare]|uniref:Amidohydrolase 3 n=1 Tax=Ketogulonicigenium vulgare (strain WSH-001) TaxID=759362 RepID=F9YA58_KETVW|nr:amidohydrolase family protein [Ketogulonicigenium vulgare]ADO43170.1 cytosine deaminase [Ketogulonicigenium vulgare Y25]AEM41469.1 Amidohydrolase 3 [Ketogulonicigenium vulgare WSH-001]ALJ81600.1 amidohydrolase [Ketogulonicigenium vulgare]ANW34277.1 amidohydrolase [Ketogulonicigenium vulgare]AOZ55208.1 cytosine deaminase [Ketogulonicigenium vulgare]